MKHLVLAAAVLAGCDSTGSGVDGGKKVVQLSATEQMQLCQYFHDEYTTRQIDCGNGNVQTVNGGTVPECVSNIQNASTVAPDCPATVAQAEACEQALADEPDSFYCASNPQPPIICAPLINCAGAT